MGLLPILLNGTPAVEARILTPSTGVWIADVDVDLDITGIVPTGKAVLTVGTDVLVGTIDDRATGKFGSKAKVQLVGGGGGWDKPVLAQHYHSDLGVVSTQVLSSTAAEVGEVVIDSVPKVLGKDFIRTAGPASRVLKDLSWYVNTKGITVVGPRVPLPFDPTSVDILSWDGTTHRAELASDSLIQPGTILVDLRFGTAKIRDVEQSFSADGAKTIAWCDASTSLTSILGPPEPVGTRLARAIASLAKEATGVANLRRYKYRVVLQGVDGRVTLQLLEFVGEAPTFLQDVEVWGIAGSSTKFVPGSEVLVVFVDGQPTVVGTSPHAPKPIEIKLDGVRVAAGLGPHPVARGDIVATALTAICAAGGLSAATMTAALAPFLPTLASTNLFSE